MLLPGTFDFTVLHTYILLTKGEVKKVGWIFAKFSLCFYGPGRSLFAINPFFLEEMIHILNCRYEVK